MSRTAVTVDVLVAATIPMPDGYVFRAGGHRLGQLWSGLRPHAATIDAPCLAFVIRHPSAGTILVDTGMHPDTRRGLRQDFGLPMSLLFRSLSPADVPYTDQLAQVGVDADAVDRVLMTHLHVDHTSGMRLLPRARFVCAAAEWAAAHRRTAAADGYVRHHLPPEARMDVVDPERSGVAHGPFAKTLDLLGDGSIRAISTPGHTAGHLSFLLQGPGDREIPLVGDAAYTLRSIDEQRLPMMTHDDEQSRRSLHELREYLRATPDAAVVPSHDREAWRALRDDARASRA